MRIASNKYYYVYTHSANGEIFYVGKGSEGRAFTKEGRTELWKDFVSSLTYYDVDIVKKFKTSEEALLFESNLIAKIRPECNKTHIVSQRDPADYENSFQHDWQKTIKEIQAQGLTQVEIEKKTGVLQKDISRLKTGKLKDVLYSRGVAIMSLLKRREK